MPVQDIKSFIDHPPVTLYERLVARHKGRSIFTILIFFLLAFILSRLTVYLDHLGLMPPYIFANFFGTHIHHFVFGIGLVCATAFLTLTLPNHITLRWQQKFAAVYGFGLGWIVDEFGMWLHLEDDYYLRQSYDAVIIATVILVNFVYFSKIWKRIFYGIFKSLR
jgi:hypothetical protein